MNHSVAIIPSLTYKFQKFLKSSRNPSHQPTKSLDWVDNPRNLQLEITSHFQIGSEALQQTPKQRTLNTRLHRGNKPLNPLNFLDSPRKYTGRITKFPRNRFWDSPSDPTCLNEVCSYKRKLIGFMPNHRKDRFSLTPQLDPHVFYKRAYETPKRKQYLPTGKQSERREKRGDGIIAAWRD